MPWSPSSLPSSAPRLYPQCGTVFALRLGHYLDQRLIETALPDAARGMLAALPSMRTQEAIAFGEGVALPMHIRFGDLPPDRRPRSDSAEFSKAWQSDAADAGFLDEGIRRWHMQPQLNYPQLARNGISFNPKLTSMVSPEITAA